MEIVKVPQSWYITPAPDWKKPLSCRLGLHRYEWSALMGWGMNCKGCALPVLDRHHRAAWKTANPWWATR